MTPRRSLFAALGTAIVMMVGLVACGSSTDDSAGSGGAAAVDWQTAQLVDVDGQTFTIAELDGPVFVENFATWCTTCRAQLGSTQKAAEALGADATFVVLSVETELSPDEVAAYAEDNGFTSMRFAVMSREVLASFVSEFGTSAANPPSTPHVIIDAAGVAGDMDTGTISAGDIEEAMRAAA